MLVFFFFADGKEGDSCITSYQYRGKGKYGKEIVVVSNVTLVLCYPSRNHYGVVRRFADGPSAEPHSAFLPLYCQIFFLSAVTISPNSTPTRTIDQTNPLLGRVVLKRFVVHSARFASSGSPSWRKVAGLLSCTAQVVRTRCHPTGDGRDPA